MLIVLHTRVSVNRFYEYTTINNCAARRGIENVCRELSWRTPYSEYHSQLRVQLNIFRKEVSPLWRGLGNTNRTRYYHAIL